MDDPSAVRARYRPAILAGAAILFAVAHTQAPLYYSNQNQYFLHGLAAAGEGFLGDDWLARTIDPTPIFSKMVELVYRYLPRFIYHVIYGLLLAVYFFSLMAIGSRLIPDSPSRRFTLLVLATMLIVVHSGLIRLVSVKLTGADYPMYLQSGLAGQYVLGPGLQPSAFGVLLLASVAAFVHRRFVSAICCSSLACTVHATYLLPAALLTLGYMASLLREGRGRTAIYLGIGSLAGVLPVAIYSLATFSPSSSEVFRESQHILAEIRIPHHTMVGRWFDRMAALQIGAVVLSIVLVRKTSLFLVSAIPTVLAICLTIVQMVTASDSLALFFAWRISAVLMPIAAAILLAFFVMRIPARRGTAWGCAAAILVVAAGGIPIQTEGLAYRPNEQETLALEYVRAHRQRGEVYLIPVHVPTPTPGTRGVPSTSFTAPPTSKQKDLISVDLQRFRLFTGVPIYVDYKAIPYKDTEVMEWYRRIKNCGDWYAGREWGKSEIQEALEREGITHLLLPADQRIRGPGYVLVHEDPYYRVYARTKNE